MDAASPHGGPASNSELISNMRRPVSSSTARGIQQKPVQHHHNNSGENDIPTSFLSLRPPQEGHLTRSKHRVKQIELLSEMQQLLNNVRKVSHVSMLARKSENKQEVREGQPVR